MIEKTLRKKTDPCIRNKKISDQVTQPALLKMASNKTIKLKIVRRLM